MTNNKIIYFTTYIIIQPPYVYNDRRSPLPNKDPLHNANVTFNNEKRAITLINKITVKRRTTDLK